ncbi:MAG: hypothetical protein V1913_10650 [Fibrobacterota bacterium]
MPNLSQILKAEISRIARRETKSFVNPLRASNFTLKKAVAELKRKVTVLVSENKRLSAFCNNTRSQVEVKPEDIQNARITVRSVKALRKKLGLSQTAFGKLLGISGQSVLIMEKKTGRLKLRSSTLASLLSIRGIGRREAKKRLEERQ